MDSKLCRRPRKVYLDWHSELACHVASSRLEGEIEAMARAAGKKLPFDIRPAIDMLGLDRVLEQVGIDRVVEEVGVDRVAEQVGVDRVVEKVGVDRFIQEVGDKELIRRIGMDRLLASLSPAERRELKRRLQ